MYLFPSQLLQLSYNGIDTTNSAHGDVVSSLHGKMVVFFFSETLLVSLSIVPFLFWYMFSVFSNKLMDMNTPTFITNYG